MGKSPLSAVKQEAFEDSSFYLAVTDTVIEAEPSAPFWQHVDAWIQAVQRQNLRFLLSQVGGSCSPCD
jgi:hypothetical protein